MKYRYNGSWLLDDNGTVGYHEISLAILKLQSENDELKKKNEKLKNDEKFLSLLECKGVDNWEGYGDTEEEFNKRLGQTTKLC